jgi:hypothetical protein
MGLGRQPWGLTPVLTELQPRRRRSVEVLEEDLEDPVLDLPGLLQFLQGQQAELGAMLGDVAPAAF